MLKKKLEKDLTGAVLASDAFFPFRDCVDTAAKTGIKAIVQPWWINGEIKNLSMLVTSMELQWYLQELDILNINFLTEK